MIPTPLTPTPRLPQSQQSSLSAAQDLDAFQWVDQFSQEMLLTVQAFQRLHDVFNTRFPVAG